MVDANTTEEILCGGDWILRKIRSVSLPSHITGQDSLLHTIVEDEFLNLYFSDEMSHAVVSVDKAGRISWERRGKGAAAGQFHYPRGMAIGSILHQGRPFPCLAVCDAWNDRIELLDLQGRRLCSWTDAGGKRFREVCDVRYFMSPIQGNQGIWLVLDRGNHRLCALSPEGSLLFEIGHALPPSLELQWTPEGPRCSFDPLYYPTRIFGCDEGSLYLYEPGSGRLKQPIFGSIFALPLCLPHACSYIGADAGLVLGWNAHSRELSWLDLEGNVRCQAAIEGRPVTSHNPATDVWIQVPNQLQHWRLEPNREPEESACANRSFRASWLASTRDLSSLPSDPSRSPFQRVSQVAGDYLAICDEFLARAGGGDWDASALTLIRERALSARAQIRSALLDLLDATHSIFLSILRLRLLSESDLRSTEVIDAELRSACEPMAKCLEPVAEAMVSTQRRLDDIYSLHQRLTRFHPELIAIGEPLIREQAGELLEWTKELMRRSSVACEAHTFVSRCPAVSVDDAAEISDMIPGQLIRRAATRLRKSGSGRLSEVDCIPVASSVDEAASGLCCVIRNSEGHCFVGFFNSGSLLRMGADGRAAEVLFGPGSARGRLSGPADLAIDAEGRLWISEYNAHRITVFDPQTGERQIIAGSSEKMSLYFPVGICPGPSGAMLVADSGNDRIAAIKLPDFIESFAGQSGAGRLEFRHPLSICADVLGAGAGFWVADERNHRLQCLDASGQFVSEIGKCGPWLDCFVMPQRVAQFADGVLAVVQNHVDQCLKLFSRQGKELNRLLLDYVPAGICIHEGTLLVTESNGRHLHVYRRE